MRDALPEFVIPRRAGQQLLALDGVLEASATPRMAEVYALRAPVNVTLRFSMASDERARVSGALETLIELQCQRCLQSFEQALVAEVDVEFGTDDVVQDDQEQDREILLGIDQKLVLVEFVEDELLLSAPMVALHAEGECQPPGKAPPELESETVASGRRRPFGDLRSLLSGGEND